tara:strand:+ start:505 stop:1350 length:846 start_codon:yes stop_codon:yes gene_type:complete
MNRRTSSRLSAKKDMLKIDKEKYINVVSGKNIESSGMSYWEVIEEMNGYRQKFKLLKQIGGSCVIYSIETAKQIASRNENVTAKDVQCSAKIKKDGSQMKENLNRLRVKENAYRSYDAYNRSMIKNELNLTDQKTVQKYDLLMDIIDALDEGYVVVAGGTPDLAYDTKYLKYNRKITMVPVFNTMTNPAGHNICIVGYYIDRVYGPSFLTKMTNPRDEKKIPKKFGSNINFLSYGILPIKYLQGEDNHQIRLVEFAKLKVKFETHEMTDLNLNNLTLSLKF